MNSLEDRLHNLANHLDHELRSALTHVDRAPTADMHATSATSPSRRTTARRDPIRLRPVTISAVVLAVAACIGIGVSLSGRTDLSESSSTNPPAAAPAPSVWDGGVGMVVYMAHGAPTDDIQAVRAALLDAPDLVDVNRVEYLDIQAVLAEAQRLLANDPNSLAFLTKDNVPTMFKVVPAPGVTDEQLVQYSQTLQSLPGVLKVETPTQSRTIVDPTAVTATSVQQATPGTTIPDATVNAARVHPEVGDYVIVAGDYPATIAARFKVRFEDLLAINGWTLAGGGGVGTYVPEFPAVGTSIKIPPGWTEPATGSDRNASGPGEPALTTEPIVTIGGG